MTAPAANQLTFFPVTGTFYAVADPSISGTINDPVLQPVNALVTFSPRLPVGWHSFVADYLVSNAFNAEQTISFIGNPVQGTWQVNCGGQLTNVMQYNVSPAGLQSELAGLSTIGAGNVLVVQGINPQSYDVEFVNGMSATEMLPLVPIWNNLVDANGYDCTITVATTTTGSPEIVAPTAVSIPPTRARIMAGVLSTIDYVDTPGVQLTSNSNLLGLFSDPTWGPDLVYDIAFSAATYNGASRILGNYAFTAPVDATPVCITDPTLQKLNYAKPITELWQPGLVPATNTSMPAAWRRKAG